MLNILLSVLSLCVLIFVHELGHFLLAKYHRVGVLAFAIGFGPMLWRKTVGETTYSLRLLPLGGFVRMVGDDPRYLELKDAVPTKEQVAEKEDKASFESIDLEESQLKMFDDRSRWFLLRGFWPKFWIVLAGPAFNIIFAIIASIALVAYYGEGKLLDKPILGTVASHSIAEKAGLKDGDFVRSIDGVAMTSWQQLALTIRGSGGKEMNFVVERTVDGAKRDLEMKVTAEPDDSGLVSDEENKKGDVYRIGIGPDAEYQPVPFSEAIVTGSMHVWRLTELTAVSIWKLLSGAVSAKHLSGPIGIFQEASKSVDRGNDSLLRFMIFLSVSLAVLNLLPIPVLDGGHIVFFIIEAIKGSPLTLRMREVCTSVGMVLLLSLMVFAVGNDLWRWYQQ